jgi:hypothetical protein
MQFGKQISEQDLLSEIHQATREVAETSAHVRRRLREAQLCLRQLQHVEAPRLGDTAQKPLA